jgi:hypothetical protein
MLILSQSDSDASKRISTLRPGTTSAEWLFEGSSFPLRKFVSGFFLGKPINEEFTFGINPRPAFESI